MTSLAAHAEHTGGIQKPLQSALVFFEPTAILTHSDLAVGECIVESNVVAVAFDTGLVHATSQP